MRRVQLMGAGCSRSRGGMLFAAGLAAATGASDSLAACVPCMPRADSRTSGVPTGAQERLQRADAARDGALQHSHGCDHALRSAPIFLRQAAAAECKAFVRARWVSCDASPASGVLCEKISSPAMNRESLCKAAGRADAPCL